MKYNYEYIKSAYKGKNNILHFNGDLSYSDKIDVECEIHGIFKQAISSILSGKGCQQCYFDSMKGKLKYTTEEWINKSRIVHKNFYNYEKSIFTGIEKKITITCPEHGDFDQSAIVHLNGHGCKKCSTSRMVESRSYDTEKFIEVSSKKHNNKYSYEKSEFNGIRNKITITCPEHGDFEQIAYYHTYGNGCQKCGTENATSKSLPEYEIIEFINSLGIDNVKHSSRHLGFELDIFLPDHNLAIEYNGLYWHSSSDKEHDNYFSKKHLFKTQVCEENNIRLLHIFENEWLDVEKQNIWKSVIKHYLGLSSKIFARKCVIKEISCQESMDFCNRNHLQGGIRSSRSFGLFFNDTLYAVTSLGNSRYRKNYIEILRYCNLTGYTVIGGFSKFMSHVLKLYKKNIISYANRRWSNGNLYEKSGFKLNNISGPCYFYIDKKYNLYHRSCFTKKNILKKFPGSSGTESSIMYINGYRKIWDCGNKVYIREYNEK